jgi:hypothetical protein
MGLFQKRIVSTKFNRYVFIIIILNEITTFLLFPANLIFKPNNLTVILELHVYLYIRWD